MKESNNLKFILNKYLSLKQQEEQIEDQLKIEKIKSDELDEELERVNNIYILSMKQKNN